MTILLNGSSSYTKMYIYTMNKIKTKDIVLVTLQFILLIIFYIPLISNAFVLPVAIKYTGAIISFFGFLVIALAIIQLNKNLTPFPTPKQEGVLINSGLYKYIRHPIYSGIFIAAIGMALYNSSYWQLSISIILLILFYYKSNYEESLLIAKFKEYESYKKNTRRFF